MYLDPTLIVVLGVLLNPVIVRSLVVAESAAREGREGRSASCAKQGECTSSSVVVRHLNAYLIEDRPTVSDRWSGQRLQRRPRRLVVRPGQCRRAKRKRTDSRHSDERSSDHQLLNHGSDFDELRRPTSLLALVVMVEPDKPRGKTVR